MRGKIAAVVLVTALGLTLMRTAVAEGECKIEGWSYSEKAGSIYITGATTCRQGRLTIRAYDGKTDKFIVSGFTFIKGYAFQIFLDAPLPAELKIRYAVD